MKKILIGVIGVLVFVFLWSIVFVQAQDSPKIWIQWNWEQFSPGEKKVIMILIVNSHEEFFEALQKLQERKISYRDDGEFTVDVTFLEKVLGFKLIIKFRNAPDVFIYMKNWEEFPDPAEAKKTVEEAVRKSIRFLVIGQSI